MLAVDLTGIAPVLVISSPGNLELCGDRNLIKLAVPSSRAEFFASLDLAQGVLAGGAPASRLHIQRSAEEERLICRAKAVLMEVNLMSEAEAHRFLQKYSMDTGLRLAETARLILERYTTG
jgi:response regulator NasT